MRVEQSAQARYYKRAHNLAAGGSGERAHHRDSEAEELAEPVERPAAAAAAAVLLRAEREELAEGARESLKNCSSSLE